MRKRAAGGSSGPYFGIRCNAKPLSQEGRQRLCRSIAEKGTTKTTAFLKTSPGTLRKLLDGLPCIDKVVDAVEEKLRQAS